MKEKKYVIYIILGIIILGGVMFISSSYALFTTNQISKSAVTIKAGTMMPTVKVNGVVTTKLTVAANETKDFIVTLENLNNNTGKFLFYYLKTLPNGVKFGYLEQASIDIPPKGAGIILKKNEKKKYSLRVKNTTGVSQTIELGSIGGLEVPSIALPSDGHLIEKYQQKLLKDVIIEKANSTSIVAYTSGKKEEAYTFVHAKGAQQGEYTEEELTAYRYIGDNPNNYVYFNCTDSSLVNTCEVWRIIGVFTVEDENGIKEQRVKLVREDSIGEYSYDAKDKGVGSSSSVSGSNEWGDSAMMTMLNDIYYNRKTGMCYQLRTVNPTDRSMVPCEFTTTGLTIEARNMIKNTKYYLGGISNYEVNVDTYYANERGVNVYASRNQSYISKVGLIYPSDYGYTYSLGVDNTCYTNLGGCGSGNPSSSWLYPILTDNSRYYAWTMSHSTEVADRISLVYNTGMVNALSFPAILAMRVIPSVYLGSDIEWISGTGAITDPYKID